MDPTDSSPVTPWQPHRGACLKAWLDLANAVWLLQEEIARLPQKTTQEAPHD